MSSKSRSFRTRSAAKRLMSPMGPKPTVPKCLVAHRASKTFKAIAVGTPGDVEHPKLPQAQSTKCVQASTKVKTRFKSAAERQYIPLDKDVRLYLPTAEAAFHLGRKPQTLRAWHCNGNGKIQALGKGGRLLWPIADIKKFLAGESCDHTQKVAAKNLDKITHGMRNA